jgi:MoaA/NifB/PqqE/SkfB family radical SAM enzyme
MCNIWQTEDKVQLPLEFFRNLSAHLRYINLSGGEPFLREDLPEIVAILKKQCPKAKIIISSNGLATEMIEARMKAILAINPKVGVRISIDGIGEAHDAVRGIPGIFGKAMETVERLKKIGVKNLGLSFTIMDFNIDQLVPVYRLSQKLGIELAMALVQNSEIYFAKNDNQARNIDRIERELGTVIREELRSFSPKKWFRAYYDFGLLHYAKFQERLLPSGAGRDSLFIDPQGNIFPSNLINLPMGNIKERSLDDLWSGPRAEGVRSKMKKENITESWIVCTIRGEIKKNIFKVGMWIMKNKFFSKNLVF